VTRRITHVVIRGVRYPRFGHARCASCSRSKLLFYETPDKPGRALCAKCLETTPHDAK